MGELCGFLAGGCPQIPQLYFGREIADRRGGLPDSAIFFTEKVGMFWSKTAVIPPVKGLHTRDAL